MKVLEGGDDFDGVKVRRVDAEPPRRPEVAEELSPGLVGKHHVQEVLVLVRPQQLDEERMLQVEKISRNFDGQPLFDYEYYDCCIVGEDDLKFESCIVALP